jgi:hypothetical protein
MRTIMKSFKQPSEEIEIRRFMLKGGLAFGGAIGFLLGALAMAKVG